MDERRVDRERDSSGVLAALERVIRERKARRPERSYVVSLLEGGPGKIGAKITEEAGEVVEAGLKSGADVRPALVHEVADLWFHTLVLMGYHDVALAEVEAELERRFGVSGVEEKEKRVQGSGFRVQKTEGRRQKAEGTKQKAEGRRRKGEAKAKGKR